MEKSVIIMEIQVEYQKWKNNETKLSDNWKRKIQDQILVQISVENQ